MQNYYQILGIKAQLFVVTCKQTNKNIFQEMKIFNISPGSLSKCTELVLETPHYAKEWQHSHPLDTQACKFGKIRKQKLSWEKKMDQPKARSE